MENWGICIMNVFVKLVKLQDFLLLILGLITNYTPLKIERLSSNLIGPFISFLSFWAKISVYVSTG